MRKDILDVVKNRPSWILHNDEEYQLLLQGEEYAKKGNNTVAIEEFRVLLEARRSQLLYRI